MTRDELIEIMRFEIVAYWHNDSDFEVIGYEDAADAILAKLEMELEDANSKLRVALRAHQKITQQFDLTDCIKISEAALLVTDYDFDASGVLLEHRKMQL